MNNYQLIVIGSGPGGYVAALKGAKLGLKVAVVENREVGGTCLNRGCIPTKTMLHASRLYHEMTHSASLGITSGEVRADLPAIYARKAAISAKLSQGICDLFRRAGIDLFHGLGTVTGSHSVVIRTPQGEEEYTADHILVATGSVPARPPIPGLDLPGVMTSDELLEAADQQFSSIVIIGGGVIGVEFATFYADLGRTVTIVEGLDRLLPGMDREMGQSLAMTLKKRGVAVHTHATVQSVTREGESLAVHFSARGEGSTVTGQAVLCAIGRQPYLEGAFAPGLAPDMDGRRLKVDGSYQTSIPHVYAIGDVSSPVQLAHVASAQGTACVELLCGRAPSVDVSIIPACVYCQPEIACVGLSEQEAKDAGLPVKVGKAVMFGNARTVIEEAERSFIKVVARTDSHQVVGAQMMCERSTDMISQLSQAIASKMTMEELLGVMRPHPTFEEALGDCLENLAAALSV